MGTMKIVEINSSNFGSTGGIMLNICNIVRDNGMEVYTFNPAGRTQRKGLPYNFSIGNRYERYLSDKINFFTGKQGSLNIFGTRRFLKQLDSISPDIIHFHNLHSNYINLNMLFKYIRKKQIKVVWTLHDCWAITGHCPYFDIVQCDKWKNGCEKCEMYKEYPATWRDSSDTEYVHKSQLFKGLPYVHIVTPSVWLKELVEQSFLSDYPISVINNGIDLEVFRPRDSYFRENYGISPEKFVVLGVSFSWGIRKGLDRFINLAKKLDERFQIVLVGTNDNIDKMLPPNIISIHKTQNQVELAEIYSAANIFLNPTREDNFPTVNIESLACGTPVLSYGAGGSAEAFDESCGAIVSDENILKTLEKLIKENFSAENCVSRSLKYEKNSRFLEYIDIYNSI